MSQYIRKTVNETKKTIDLLVYFGTSLKYIKFFFTANSIIISKNILFPSQCGFRKGYSAQHSILVMIENFKKAFDRGDKFGVILTDLYKAFDCINHQLLIAKIDSYGVSPMSTKITFSYLCNRTQRTKTKNSFSKRSNILHDMPQGSMLGPLLFNIDLIDLFYYREESDIASYADDATPYS